MIALLACETLPSSDEGLADVWFAIGQLSQNFLGPMSDVVFQWLGSALLYGSVLAVVTWLLVKTALRRARPGVHGALWLIVLLKFVIPFGPSWSYSLDSGVTTVRSWWTPPAAVTPTAPSAGEVTFTAIPTPASDADPLPANGATPRAAKWIDPLPVVSLAYLLGVGIAAVIRTRAYARYAARCRALPRADEATCSTVAAVCARLGVRRRPDVRLSEDAPAPFLLGAFRPVLVLSRRQMTDDAQLEAVVLHEIAHLRRGDLAVRYLQWLVGTCLFFWPVVAWVNRRIDLAREHICDEWALRHGRLSAGAYARTLLSAVSPAPRLAAYAPTAMAAGRSHIERRIEMILSMRRASASVRSLGLIGGALVLAWGALTLTSAHAMMNKPCPPNAEDDLFEIPIDANVLILDAQQGELEQIESLPDDVDLLSVVHELHAKLYNSVFGAPLPDDAPLSGADLHKQVVVLGAVGGEGPEDVLFVQQFAPSPQTMENIRSKNAEFDLNQNGRMDRAEFDAYLTALVLTDPAAVIAKYPQADRNNDGKLDAAEAARLVNSNGAPPMPSMRMRSPLPERVTNEGGQFRYTTADGDTLASVAARFLGSADRAAELLSANQDVLSNADALKPGMTLKLPGPVQFKREQREVRMLHARSAIRAGEPAEISIRTTTSDGKTETTTESVEQPRRAARVNEPVAAWALANLKSDPTIANVRAVLPAVEEAPLAIFMEANPGADTNQDGKLTVAERAAYLEKHESRMRARVLEKNPEADADGDGVLSPTEMRDWAKSRHAGARVMRAAGGPEAGGAFGGTRRVAVKRIDSADGEATINVEVESDGPAAPEKP